MATIHFYADGKLRSLTTQTGSKLLSVPKPAAKSLHPKAMASRRTPSVMSGLHSQLARLEPLFHSVREENTLIAVPKADGPAIIPTPTLIVEGANKAELTKLRDEFKLEILKEGSEGKVLLRSAKAGEEGVIIAATAAMKAYKMKGVEAAQPNFVRIMQKVKPSAAGGTPLWNLLNSGNPGVAGADVAAQAAWTITKGDASIRVAVLDEGVDVTHPDLKAAVVAQKDFVDNNPTAQPDGDDSHGTACSGIILSRSTRFSGIAPECSLVAIRIAKGDGADGWIITDFGTANAIDWAWDAGKADVLSNSWGGGVPSDAISRAFERARTLGRNKKGCVIAIATGNNNGAVNFPATIPNVLAVGASNPWDVRKSPTSKDGESWWGSNYGKEVSLVAPGVQIATTDIKGARGYNKTGDYVTNFNGTSSATPHVAAAAALVLSIKPALTEKEVRAILLSSTDAITPNGKRNNEVGNGRLNVFRAIRLAMR